MFLVQTDIKRRKVCYTGYRALRWQRHPETTAVSKLCSKQAASFLFPIQMQLKCTFLFLLYVRVCITTIMVQFQEAMHAEIACGLWFWLQVSIQPAVASSVSSHQFQYNIPTFEALLRKKVHLCLERWKKSNTVMLLALIQSDCIYMSSYFEHYLSHFNLCLSARTLQCLFVWVRVMPQHIRTLPGPGECWTQCPTLPFAANPMKALFIQLSWACG